MATTLCLINQKGGCGKSSTCFHLGGQLALEGDRVLLIDADPQGSLSQGFFGSERVERLTSDQTLAAVFRVTTPLDPRSLVAPTPIERLDIVRANQTLVPHNAPQPETLGLAQYAFASLLEGLSSYDWVLIDCPPNLYACSWNSLVASDAVIIPTPPEDFGTQGLRAVHHAIDAAAALNPRLVRLGHLVTRRDSRLLIHHAYEQKLRQLYNDTFQTVVSEASAFKVALACRQPVGIAQPRSRAAHEMGQLAAEVQDRLGRRLPTEEVA